MATQVHIFPIGTGDWFNRAMAANSTQAGTLARGVFFYTDEMCPLDAPDILPSGSVLSVDDKPVMGIAARDL